MKYYSNVIHLVNLFLYNIFYLNLCLAVGTTIKKFNYVLEDNSKYISLYLCTINLIFILNTNHKRCYHE